MIPYAVACMRRWCLDLGVDCLSTVLPRYQGLRGAARAINAEAGWRGFYKGFAPCVLRAFPANAACFLAYEVALKVLPEKW